MPSFEYEVPSEFELVASNVDETRDALAAFMAPSDYRGHPRGSSRGTAQEADVEGEPAVEADAAELTGVAESADGQLQIQTEVDASIPMIDEPGEAEVAQEPERSRSQSQNQSRFGRRTS